METKANYVLVGIFTVVVLVLSFAFIYWSANVSNQDSRIEMLVRIEGSVTGLGVGSQVLFNGLPVGDVRSLRIDTNDPRVVIAATRIESTTPITTSTRATIGFAGLTGQAFIELKGGDVTERNIISTAQEQGVVPVIKADPSDVTDILATAKDIAERADNILSQFEGVVQDVGPAVRTTADNVSATSANIKVFTDSLAANSGQIDEFLGSISRLATTANTVAEALPEAIGSAQAVIAAVDPASVRTTIDNVAAMSQTLREQSDQVASVVGSVRLAADAFGAVGETVSRNTPAIDRFLANVGPISDTAASVATRLDATLGSAEKILAGVDPTAVSTTLNNAAAVSQTLREQSGQIATVVDSVKLAAQGLGSVGETFTRNTPAIDRFLANVGPISDTAASVATRLDATLGSAEKLLAGVDPTAVSTTLNNAAAVSQTLREQSGQIASVVDSVKLAAQGIGSVGETFTRNTPAIDRFLANVGPISDTAASVATRLDATLGSAEKILAGVDPSEVASAVSNVSSAAENISGVARSIGSQSAEISQAISGVTKVVANVDRITGSVAENSEVIREFLAGVGPLTANANQALTSFNDTLGSANRVIGAVDPDDVRTTVDSIAGVAATINARRDAIGETITNASGAIRDLGQVTQSLTANREGVDRFVASLGPIGDNAARASARIAEAADSANALVSGLDGARITETIDNVATITAGIGAKTAEIQSIIDGVDGTVRTAGTALAGFDETRRRVDGIVAGIDPELVNRAVTNVSSATDTVARAANSIADIANDVGARREDINRIITNVELATTTVSKASGKLDTILASVDGLLNSPGTDGLVSQATLTLKSIRDTAASINAQVAPISANIQNFSGNGLQEVRTLVREVTRSVNRIEGAVSDFQADPSRLIFGGDEVKQFDGRTRR